MFRLQASRLLTGHGCKILDTVAYTEFNLHVFDVFLLDLCVSLSMLLYGKVIAILLDVQMLMGSILSSLLLESNNVEFLLLL